MVDHAHRPNSLRALISTARRLTGPEGRVHVVVGARGGRDRQKRPETARAASTGDGVILTTDNPGDEDPSDILSQLSVGLSREATGRVRTEPDRRTAIHLAIDDAAADDVVVIAGRGDETAIRIGDQRLTPR